ncbi:pimeloyl-ACP methyl ester carboxylesterase [Nocardioides zeae]|uniref:Pimeloyl-ACP methyl ester carboxylesterase n=1 Tax=Nocardioides zeae TaxID=1457234 RepID=A0ACC6IH21_9ACTN|nr:alpha/beta hydrolase [Nocardioides zeae]MDR6173024.1 pimeloyl-ACP methyl ester carboxylesterase [Nocardioides zeae]MDR6210017.1 pimeloyl-ACP methyl ester carboxylesterase [Nocardioides zeae]
MTRAIVPASAFPAGHPGRDLLTARTPFLASRSDQRFSYALQLPSTYADDSDPLHVLVAVHGTGRRAERYLDAFADFGEQHGVAVLAPFFPAGISDPNDVHNYKFIAYDDIRFDLVLLAMLDEAATRWNLAVDRFALHGFSGGGQFSHRFLYLHPDRLSAVSIGAPGRVTLPDRNETWWKGVGDIEERFGLAWRPDVVASVPTQLVIGALDDRAQDLATVEPDGNGATRRQRLDRLAEHLRGIGCEPLVTVVPDVAHDAMGVLPVVRDFLAARVVSSLPERRPPAGS